MKRYNIVTARTYEKGGEEKKAWLNVGSLVRFDATQDKSESYILELNMHPTTKFYIFEQKPRDAQPNNNDNF